MANKTVPHYPPRARYFDSNGLPLALGRVSFYYANTSTYKNVFTTREGDVLASNPQDLDASGYVRDGAVWLGEGEYKVVVESSDGAGGYIPEWSVDNVPGATATPTGSVGDVGYVRTISDLTAIQAGSLGACYVYGYYDETDNGGGWFIWDDNSSDTPDGGSVIAPNGVPAFGRWFRVFNDSEINANQWGAMTGASGSVNSQLTAMMNYAVASDLHKVAILPSGEYRLSANLNFTGDFTLVINEGAYFTSTTATKHTLTVSCTDAKVNGISYLVDNKVDLVWIPVSKSDAYVEMWGIGSGLCDRDVLARITAVGRVVFTGAYDITPDSDYVAITVDRAHFKRGSYVASPSPTNWLAVTFANYTTDDGINDIFQGNFRSIFVNGDNICINHFKDCIYDDTAYANMLLSITEANDGRVANVKWDYRTTVTATATLLTSSYRFYSEIINNTVVKFTNPLYIGFLLNGPEKIFDYSSTSSAILLNRNMYVQWWGASYVDMAGEFTAEAIEAAYKTQAINYANTGSLAVIDGDKGNFRLKSTVDITNQGAPFFIRNMDIIVDDGFTGTYAFNIDAPTNMQDMEIYLRGKPIYAKNNFSAYHCEFTSLASYNNIIFGTLTTGTPIDYVSLKQCEFTVETGGSVAANVVGYGVSKIDVDSCKFTGYAGLIFAAITGSVTSTIGTFNNSTVYNPIRTANNVYVCYLRGRWNVTNSTFDNIHLNVDANDSVEGFTKVSGCTINAYGILVNTSLSNATTDVIITQNIFKDYLTGDNSPFIYFYAQSSNTYANGVIVKDNIFDWQYGSGNIYNDKIVYTTNYASYGHLRCQVTNNVCRGTVPVYSGTDQHYKLIRADLGTTSATVSLSTSGVLPGGSNSEGCTLVVFPAREVPLSAYLYIRGNQYQTASPYAVQQYVSSPTMWINDIYGVHYPLLAFKKLGTNDTKGDVWGKLIWNDTDQIQNASWLF